MRSSDKLKIITIRPFQVGFGTSCVCCNSVVSVLYYLCCYYFSLSRVVMQATKLGNTVAEKSKEVSHTVSEKVMVLCFAN